MLPFSLKTWGIVETPRKIYESQAADLTTWNSNELLRTRTKTQLANVYITKPNYNAANFSNFGQTAVSLYSETPSKIYKSKARTITTWNDEEKSYKKQKHNKCARARSSIETNSKQKRH